MSRREARLARTVGTSIPDKDVVKEKISNDNKYRGNDKGDEGFVDLPKGFSGDPLINRQYCKNPSSSDGGIDHNVGSFVPIHSLIITQKRSA